MFECQSCGGAGCIDCKVSSDQINPVDNSRPYETCDFCGTTSGDHSAECSDTKGKGYIKLPHLIHENNKKIFDAVLEREEKVFPSESDLLMDEFKPLESDPTGRSAKDPGAKLDAGKPRCAEVLELFSRALWAVSVIGTFGAEKYDMGSWKFVPEAIPRYANAEMRHKLKRWMGETSDKDSKLLHLAHEAWNSLAQLEKYLEENKEELEKLL